MNIVLIGYRGSGKSVVGRALADRLGWPLLDTDSLVEQSAGMSIREIFDAQGEAGFRDLESKVIADAAHRDQHIISLGGGAVVRKENMAVLKSTGKVVWLTAPPEVLWERISADTGTRSTRPALTQAGGFEEVREMLSRRMPDYANASDVQVDTVSRSVPEIGFASPVADGPGGTDAGMVGIVFGGRRLTGENIFTVNQVATSQLPGVKFFGSQVNGQAGAVISNAGDFNGDGTEDLLVCAPNETRTVGGQTRRGVAYLIFGGPHLTNGSFNLIQVGTSAVPGLVLVSPYADGSADTAPIDWVGTAGDVDADGFADILVGVSTADFVNPLEPSQRRVDSGEMYLIYGSNTGSNSLQ